MSNFTFLSIEQVDDTGMYGNPPNKPSFFCRKEEKKDNRIIQVYSKRRCESVELSDFTVLKGACRKLPYVCDEGKPYGAYYLTTPTLEHNYIETGEYDYDLKKYETWLKYTNDFQVILSTHNAVPAMCNSLVARITTTYSDIKDNCARRKVVQEKEWHLPVVEVEYGEYPQSIASKEIQDELEVSFNNKELIETGKTYTIEQKYKEYEYKGEKYIRIKACNNLKYVKDNVSYKKDDIVWIKVEPIKWLVDEEKDIAVTDRGLFTKIPFDLNEYYTGIFESTYIKKYLDEHFAKDIIPSRIQKPNTDYSAEDILTNDYNMNELKSMSLEDKKKVIISITETEKERIQQLRRFAEELGIELGNFFDSEIKNTKSDIKVKAKTK